MTTDSGQKAAGLFDYLKGLPQYLLPLHLVSRVVHAFTRIRAAWIRVPFTSWFVNKFNVDMSEAEISDPATYEHFNAFFTRPLRSDARPLAPGEQVILSPVDGTVSQLGALNGEKIVQAKGHYYDLTTLLGGSEERAAPFLDGRFINIYLSPRNYHRIHMPLTGALRSMVHVPGRLFSVSPATTRVIPGLFARNERVISLFDTAAGPLAIVKVGAVNVGSIETVWAGEVTPPAGREIRVWDYTSGPTLKAGAEAARFNMGSTVILLLGSGCATWDGDNLRPEVPVKMGQLLGNWQQSNRVGGD